MEEEVIVNEKEKVISISIWYFKVENVCDFVFVLFCKFIWDVMGVD